MSKKILISFVGSNDAGKLQSDHDGAILTALSNEHFDELILLWNNGKTKQGFEYHEIVRHIKQQSKNLNLAKRIYDEEIQIEDVTDHNEIYSELKKFTDSLDKNDKIKYTASISSGTPAMSVCWILLAESGDFSEQFPLRLIKVGDPRFGKSKNIEVKLNTALPKIIRMKNELNKLKTDLIPKAIIDIKKGQLTIGDNLINLAPIEFCYYRYFAELQINAEDGEKVSGIFVNDKFLSKIIDFHAESFEDYDSGRQKLEIMLNKKEPLATATFRGNISKINKKIRQALDNETLADFFQISSEGKRGAKFYGIKVPPEKLKILH